MKVLTDKFYLSLNILMIFFLNFKQYANLEIVQDIVCEHLLNVKSFKF